MLANLEERSKGSSLRFLVPCDFSDFSKTFFEEKVDVGLMRLMRAFSITVEKAYVFQHYTTFFPKILKSLSLEKLLAWKNRFASLRFFQHYETFSENFF